MNKLLQKALCSVLTLGMVFTSLQLPVVATEQVITSSGSTELEVEYFNSTLYNWDEDAANAATAKADLTGGTISTKTVYQYKPVTSITSGSKYLLVSARTGYLLGVTTGARSSATGIAFTSNNVGTSAFNSDTNLSNYLYTITTSGSGYTVVNNNKYLTVSNNGANIASNVSSVNRVLTISSGDGYFDISRSGYYLNNFGGDNSIAAGWTDNGAADIGSRWILMEYTGTAQVEVVSGGSQAGKGFYFTNGNNKQTVPSFSMWSGQAQNWHIYSGLAASKLSESTNSPFSADVNAADLFCNNGDNSYTTRYTNVPVPFVYEDGYYYLDSDKYGVYLDDVSNITKYGYTYDGNTMSIADKPSYTSDNGVSGAGFQPFAKIDSSTSSINTTKRDGTSVSAYNTSGNQVFGFGMVTSVPFQMTDNGQDENGKDIIFEFCGDDDVWVYVDGNLVLDLGGTHDAITGTINFATGDVTVDALNNDYVGDKAVCRTGTSTGFGDCTTHNSQTISQTNMYNVLDTTLTGFASEGNHTLTVYYMDRGKGKTNCLIKFNLPQRDYVSVTKNISNTYADTETLIDDTTMAALNNIDFSFTLYNDNQTVANKAYSIYTNNVLVGRGTTDASGNFTLKNGQTATFKNIVLDEQTSYYVVENNPGERWSTSWREFTNAKKQPSVEPTADNSSKVVTVEGSETTTDYISFECTNEYEHVSNLGLDVNNETIVLDYGLPVEIDVLVNDIVSGKDCIIDSVNLDQNQSKLGSATINNKKVIYTPDRELNKIDTITYTVVAKDPTNNQTISKEGTVTIIPATSVYYEENYNVTYSTGWGDAGSPIGGNQETGLVGTSDDSTYGTDKLYLTNLGDSYGTTKYKQTEGAAIYKYSFTGKGTAIYGRISPETGYIRVQIRYIDENGGASIIENTYIDTKVLESVNSVETLYNIPIYMNTELEFNTYEVVIGVYAKGTKTATNENAGGEFYFDGYRVFEPMNDDTTALSAYAQDGEANVAVVNIHSKVVKDFEAGEYGDDFCTLTDINDGIQNIDVYNDIGPNEELYLTEDNHTASISLLNWNSQQYHFYLGMKAPSGQAAKVQVGTGTITLNNSMDCYYDVSKYITVETDEDGTVGTLTITGVSGLAALTNIKVVGNDKFELGYSGDVEINGDEINYNSLDDDTLYLVPPQLVHKQQNDDDNSFVPAAFDALINYAKTSKKATISVISSQDVAYITVNRVMSSPKVIKNQYKFTYSEKKVAKGTIFEVIAYDQNGNASEVYTLQA